MTPIEITLAVLGAVFGTVSVLFAIGLTAATRDLSRRLRTLQGSGTPKVLRRVETLEVAWEDLQKRVVNALASLRQERYKWERRVSRALDEGDEEEVNLLAGPNEAPKSQGSSIKDPASFTHEELYAKLRAGNPRGTVR